MKKIFITGGSGLMGTNAVEYFSSKGYSVLNYDKREPQNKLFKNLWVQGDINDLDFYLSSVKQFKPDYFLHLAARTDLLEKKNLYDGYKTNILGVENTIKVIDSCISIKRVLFASSRLVCKIDYLPKSWDDYCPPNLYGESKVIGEKIVKSSNIRAEWAIFRPTSIWGPWFDSPYIIFFQTIKKNFYFHPGKYKPKKSFGYVKNSIFQLEKLFLTESEYINNKSFYLCDYPAIDVSEWANLIQEGLGTRKIPVIPSFLLKNLSLFGDVLYRLGWNRVPLTSFRYNNLITDMVYDTRNLEFICGDLPYNLKDSVNETIDWMASNSNRDKLALAKIDN